jgi:nucleoside-diphosphate-sugar epimerase
MRLLILGGTSFIGPHVCGALLAQGHEVTVFNRGRTSRTIPGNVKNLRGDRHHLGRHITELRDVRADVVIDMICMTRHDAADLVEVFRGHAGRAVVVSSADVYRNFGGLIGIETGQPNEGPLPEGAPLRTKRFPFRAQAKSSSDPMYEYDKLDVEETVRSGWASATLLRLPMVYGEGDRQRRFSAYVKAAIDSTSIVLGKTHAAWRTHRGYVENMSDAIVKCVLDERSTGRTYNVADAQSLSELELAQHIAAAMGRTPGVDVKVVEDSDVPASQRFPGEARYALEIDSGLIRSELGHTDRVATREAIERTVRWEMAMLK